MRKCSYFLGAALFLQLLTTSASATVTFTLTNVGSGANLAGVYTSPYTGSISGVGTGLSVICDDFANDSYVPEEWTANVTSLSSLDTSPTISSANENTTVYWGTGTGGASGPAYTVTGSITSPSTYTWTLSQGQAYEAAALLSLDILNAATGSQAQKDYSYALWELFDSNPPGNTSNKESDPTSPFAQLVAYGATTDESNALSYLISAITEVKTGTVTSAHIGVTSNVALATYLSGYNTTIYSYAGNAECGTNLNQTCTTAPPQEFITVTTMAEPPSLAVLGVDLLGVAALLLFIRRRTAKPGALIRP